MFVARGLRKWREWTLAPAVKIFNSGLSLRGPTRHAARWSRQPLVAARIVFARAGRYSVRVPAVGLARSLCEQDDVASSERLPSHSARGRLFQHRFRADRPRAAAVWNNPAGRGSAAARGAVRPGGAVSLPHHRSGSRRRGNANGPGFPGPCRLVWTGPPPSSRLARAGTGADNRGDVGGTRVRYPLVLAIGSLLAVVVAVTACRREPVRVPTETQEQQMDTTAPVATLKARVVSWDIGFSPATEAEWVERVVGVVRESSADGVDVLVFPELFAAGLGRVCAGRTVLRVHHASNARRGAARGEVRGRSDDARVPRQLRASGSWLAARLQPLAGAAGRRLALRGQDSPDAGRARR